MSHLKMNGLILGAIVGVILVSLGILAALVVSLFAFIGWLIGKYLDGDLPMIDDLLSKFLEFRSKYRD
ncbi:uncharacterized protein METZ01_LOCUS124480 [marine metagenome]|uniref:DUF2273 domain-containing protein n=1 Tax=marine metagenome TaxID=408172 RepID=A0A381Y3C6_9ZZZZ